MNRRLAEILVALAKKEVGVTEADGTNCGPRVNQYKGATNLPNDQGWPWCAAFICWLVREAMDLGKAGGARYSFTRPTTAGAFDLANWSREQDDSTQTKSPVRRDIQPGDIVIFKYSHVGIATSAPDGDGMVRTIEGNTDSAGSREGGGVFAKKRALGSIKTRIRFTV